MVKWHREQMRGQVEHMQRVRRRYRVVVLAAIVAALIVPVGFALSLSSSSAARRPGVVVRAAVPVESVAMSSAVLIERDPVSGSLFDDLPDSVKLLLVGTTLLGIAVAVRKTA